MATVKRIGMVTTNTDDRCECCACCPVSSMHALFKVLLFWLLLFTISTCRPMEDILILKAYTQ